jgi:hypothetical protein
MKSWLVPSLFAVAVSACDVRAPIGGGFDLRVTPIAPTNGAGFGQAGTAHPALRWRGGTSATRFHLQMDDSCMGTAACDFPSPEVDEPALTETSFVPAIELPYRTSAPVGRRYYWRVRACADDVCGAWSPVRTVVAGRSAGALNTDFNGDGYADLVIAAPSSSAVSELGGQVFVYLGGPTMSATPAMVLGGPHVRDEYGATVAMVGDVNGDGYGDFLVRSNGDEGTPGRAPTPHAYLMLGGGPNSYPAGRSFTAGIVDDENMAAAGIGDVNGDGYDDFAFAGIDADVEHHAIPPARVEIHFGGPTFPDAADLILYGNGTDFFGSSVAGGGDVNGDGYPDIVVGGHQAPGSQAHIYFGGPGMDAVADVTLANPTDNGDSFGHSVAIAGDVNGDGYDDVVVGAPGHTGHPAPLGRACVFFGGQTIHAAPDVTFASTVEAEMFGYTVAPAGDVNGDGFADVAVITPGVQVDFPAGVPGRVASDRRVDVFFGGATLDTDPDVTVAAGPSDPNARGFAAIDLDGDMLPDLVIGRWVTDYQGVGQVAIYPGSGGYTTAALTLSGAAPGDSFGAKIAR